MAINTIGSIIHITNLPAENVTWMASKHFGVTPREDLPRGMDSQLMIWPSISRRLNSVITTETKTSLLLSSLHLRNPRSNLGSSQTKYGFSLDLSGEWKSEKLFFQVRKLKSNGLTSEKVLESGKVSPDILDYNWAAYSATGDLKYAEFVKSNIGNQDYVISGAAEWSYRSMANQDSNIPKL